MLSRDANGVYYEAPDPLTLDEQEELDRQANEIVMKRRQEEALKQIKPGRPPSKG